MSLEPKPCPACGSARPATFVESHFDSIGGRSYEMRSCGDCGVVFSDPRDPVGPEWYEKAAPIRHRESRPAAASDWRFRQFFADRLPPGRLLDLCCGDGAFMLLAAAQGFQVAGFDYDARVVSLGKAAGLSDIHADEFFQFSAGRMPGKFDVITLFDVLEHFPEPARFFNEIKRLLRPGGHVVLTLPNALRPLPWGRDRYDFPPHHFTRWTPEAMTMFLNRNGFSVLRQEATTLELSYISEHCFFFCVMPRVLPLVKRALFGRESSPERTMTELYHRSERREGFLSDKLLRQRIVNAVLRIFQAIFAPAAWCLRRGYRRSEPRSGACLYTLARMDLER